MANPTQVQGTDPTGVPTGPAGGGVGSTPAGPAPGDQGLEVYRQFMGLVSQVPFNEHGEYTIFQVECEVGDESRCIDELGKWVSSLTSDDSLLVIEYDTVSKVTAILRALTVRKHHEWKDYNAYVFGTAYYRGTWAKADAPETWVIDHLKIVVQTSDARENVDKLVNDLKEFFGVVRGTKDGLRRWNDAFDIAAELLQLFTDVLYPWPSTPGNRTAIWDTGGDYPEYEVKIVYYG